MARARKHHFISQFYLSGFTSDETKAGVLFCFDIQTKRVRETKTKQAAYQRDFNLIQAPGVESGLLESELGKLERQIAPVFLRLRTWRRLPEGEDYALLMNFIALLGVRNPSLRTSFDRFRTELYRKMMSMTLRDEARWEALKRKAIEDGHESFREISYADINKMILSDGWEVRGQPDSFHSMEFNTMKDIVQLLAARDWSIVRAPEGTFFVTSDRPVVFEWTILDPGAPHGPGFGSLNSAVYFTLNRSMALLGRFNDTSRIISVPREFVAAFNSIIAQHAVRFVYSSEPSFVMLNEDGQETNPQDFLGFVRSK